VFAETELNEKYTTLAEFSHPFVAGEREIIGREYEVSQLMAAMSRPELCNAMLLAPAGAGKTALVQAAMLADTERAYMEVDLAKMIADLTSPDEMASILKRLFDDAETYSRDEHQELVLFIDEFHQVVQLSAAAVEALKPVLAASGTRGIRVIAATTYDEFHEHVRPNQALVERLQRINVNPPDKATTVTILRGMAERYEVGDQFYDNHMFESIYELTNRYMPAQVQPRKSILVLDAMVGWHRFTGRPMDRPLLADVLMESTNVNVAFRVDAVNIKEQLDRKVYSQDYATRMIEKRLQLCVADLNDKTRPMSSFLMTGSTGVGKEVTDDTPVPVYSEDGSVDWKLHGKLVAGDFVFDRQGRPTEVLGVFPQGVKDVYRVTLGDGRTLDVGGPHLWSVYTAKARSNKHAGKEVQPRTMTTLEMIEKGVVRIYDGDSREHLKFFIPANGAAQWPERSYEVDPYLVGAFIGNGCLTLGPLTLSSNDAHTVLKAGELLGAVPKSASQGNCSWVFPTGEKRGSYDALFQTEDVFASVPGMAGIRSGERRIPRGYMSGSVDQRWELIRGLFDTDGTIDPTTGRYNISYSTFSKGLADDVRELLFSVGVANTLKTWVRERDGRSLVEHDVHVKVGNDDKAQFFSLPRKRSLAEAAAVETQGRQRVKKFDMVGIRSIEKLPEQQSASCIYVANEEHLYQAGQFVVTHNTELTKQLAKLLFGNDQGHLIRFDMSEFALDESLDLFRSEITRRVWDMGHAVLLLDEVEKASQLVIRMLLQVLDDGRLSDDNGRQVSFLNTYIVMTTNAGAEIYKTIAEYNADDTGSGKDLVMKMKEIRKSLTQTMDGRFPPELLGRIDVIVPFQPLSRETLRKIVVTKLYEMVQEVLSKHGVRVQVSKRVLTYLIDDKADTSSDAGGARIAIGKMTDEITTEIAAYVNAHPEDRLIYVEIIGDMWTEDKELLLSDSYVEVGPVSAT
jgi:ATP-dependent Clp protease ATP-binding subunit ClpA